MRKTLPLLVVGILVLGGLGAVAGTESNEEKFLSESIVFSQPVIREEENYISLELAEATSGYWGKDKPNLPVISKTYTFPFGTRIDNVEVTFSSPIELEISKPIMPSPEIRMLSAQVSYDIEQSETVLTYSDIDIYPEHRYGYKTGGGIRDGENVVYLAVHLNPVQYIPRENTICYSEKATIDITYTPTRVPVTFADEYDLLILTPTQFESALERLVTEKNNNGIKTIMVTLNDIPSVGLDKQEDIKYYIRDAKENWGIDYVLLVGAGVKGQELFPVRYAWVPSGGIESSFPSDLYYADIYDAVGGFPDWDYDDDGKYAEYDYKNPLDSDMEAVDFHPDVYLARIPCNNVGEVNTIIDKIIEYNKHNMMTKKILQVGGDTFTGDPGGVNEGEYANEEVLKKLLGYSTTRLWASHPNPGYSTKELTKGNIADGFKSYVDFIDFSGHGGTYAWGTHPHKDEDNWLPEATAISPSVYFLKYDFDLYNINNGVKYPVVVYNACSNNKFSANEQCLGWKTLSKAGGGGIASYAASGIGYGSYGTHETERVMGWMEVHVFEELYNNKILGQCWANCVSDYYNTFEPFGSSEDKHTDYKTMLEFCMFGDPTLAAENGDDPKNVPVNRPVFHGFLEKLMDYFPRLARIFELIVAKLS